MEAARVSQQRRDDDSFSERGGALGLSLIVAAPAQATFPGRPGPIAFQRLVDLKDEENMQIFSVEGSGGNARKVTTGGSGFNPDYSPDGKQLVFERRFGGMRPDAIVWMGADGSDPTLIETTCAADPCLGDNSPAWSPDGSQFMFERAFGPIINDEASGGLALVTASADGSNERVLFHFRSVAGERREPHDAQWSPDGTRIAVSMLNIKAKPRNGSAIHVLDADGSDMRKITPSGLTQAAPDRSPDGRRIAFNSSYEGQGAFEIYTVRPDGNRLRRMRQLTHGKRPDFRPDWGTR